MDPLFLIQELHAPLLEYMLKVRQTLALEYRSLVNLCTDGTDDENRFI